MKCREAQHWLYSFRPNTSWPAELVGHLQECSKCQSLHTTLKQIDLGVGKLTSTGGESTAKQQLLDRVAQAPQSPAPSELTPKAPWPWGRWGAFLTGAAALLLFGWLVGRFGGTSEVPTPTEVIKPVEVVREKIVEKIRDRVVHVHSSAERDLFATLLKRNARLVQASQPSDRLEALLDMADDCRQHALTLLEHGPRDSLPLTVELYTQLLRDGVLGQIVQAPTAARPALQVTARIRLGKMTELPAQMLPSVLADHREAVKSATQEALAQVDHPEEALPAKPRRLSEPMAPTAALVQFALTASSAADPVVKAELCAEYVQRLMPTMRLYLADESAPQRAQMGQQFGELLQHGVYTPLELAAAKEPPAPIKLQAERIIESAAQAVADMQKDLETAPADARPGWEKALEATKKGFEKNKVSGKGNAGKGPRDIRGQLRNIDPAKGTITVAAKIKGRDGAYTFALTKDVVSFITTRSVPSDWRVGMEVQLRLSDDRQAVIDIKTAKGNDGQRNQK